MKSNQRGGIVSFIVVTLALVGLLAGGLYLSKIQARQVRDGGTPAGQVSTNQPKDEQKTPAGKGNEGSEGGAANEPAAPADSRQTGGTSTPAAPTDRVASTGPTGEIPATGPADTAFYVAGLGILAYTSYQFIQSRRLVRANALKR